MATPDQILTALREADRQGNVEDATQLAQMYKTATEAPTEESDAQIAARAKGESIPEGEGFFTSAGQALMGSGKSTLGGIMQFGGAEESGRELAKEGQEQGKNYPSVGDLPALYRTEGLGAALSRTLPAIGYDLARTAPVIGAGLTAGAVAPAGAVAGLGAATLAEVGAYGLSATGENMNRQQAQIDAGTRKEFNRAAAFGSGMAQGVLEKVGVNQILGKAGLVGERVAQQIGARAVAEEVLAASTRTGLGTAGRVLGSTAETAALEGSVEALQEGLGRAQAGQSLTDKEALEAYGSSALGGVLVGGAMRAPFATLSNVGAKDRAVQRIEDFGNVGLDILNDTRVLTPEEFEANGKLMAVGIARNTDGSENAKTRQQAYAELEAKVKTQEQFDTEAARKEEEQARKQAGFEALSQTQLEDEFADEFAGAPRPEGALTPEEIETIQTNKRQQDLFGKESGTPAKGEASTLEPTATLQVTPSGEALLNQEQIDAQDFRRLAEKQHQELIDAGVKSEATKEMSKLLEKTRVGTQVDLVGGKKGTLKEEVIPARVQDFGTAPIQEDVVTRAAQQAKATADMGKVLEKTKEGEQVDLFGGKKGTIKEVAIPEAKVAETVAPKQEDLLDEAKQLEFPRLLTALKGLTETGEGGPDVATLLGKPPTGQRKATDFATAVHAEVGAQDTDVITPAHVAEAGVRDLELGKVIEKAGGLPISDPKVSEAINKLTPEKQVALTNVLSKEYSPENYIKPSEMLVSKQELLNLKIPERSDLIGELFTKPKVETVNVVNNPAGAQQVITKLVAISKNKNAPPAVQAAALQKAVAIEQTLAKVKAANNKAVAAKAVTTKGTDTNIVTKGVETNIKTKKPDWEMTRDEYKNSFDPRDYKDSNYDRMIRGAVSDEKITQAEADKKLIRDYSGNKYHWAKTRKELEQEKKSAVSNARGARAEGNKNPVHSVKWAQKSESGKAKKNIDSTIQYQDKLLEVHPERIQEALNEGKPVPQEVLNEYPNLKIPTETKVKDEQAYSVAPVGITTGHTIASLSKALSPELKRLVASGKAVLHDTAATLPGTGHPANVQGMTTADGVTHYVANKLTPSTIQNVALHEVGVHAGMRKMLGSELWAYVKHQAMTNQSPAFVKARASVPKGTPDHLIAEETLAYLVENSPNLSLVRQIVASIRNFMRSKLGANIRLSEADARQMATAAMRRESKTAERTSRDETAFSKEKLLAPNGQPSNLNAMQHAQVRTPEFKKWFGDWENDPENASKVVDENGEPLVVYHKTRAFKDFTEFDPTKSVDGWDIHFGTKEAANNLSLLGNTSDTRIVPAFLNIKHMPHTNHDDGHWGQHQLINAWEGYWRALPVEDKRRIRDMQVSDGIKNDYGSGFGKYIKNKAIDIAKSGTSGSMVLPKFMADEMFKYGMTGLSYRNAFEDKGSTSYIVMAPNQIKSAIGNTGAFSAENPDIRYSVNKGGFNANIPSIRKKANAIATFSREQLPSYLELFSAAGIRELGAKYLRGKEKDGVPSKNSASEILKDTREITGMTNKLLEEYLDLRKQINKYIKEHRQQVGILGDTANSATILQVSPSEIDTNSPNNIDNRIESELLNQDVGYAQRVKELRALKVSWGQLNPQSKAMYKKVADFYAKSYKDYVAAEKYRIKNDADVSDEDRARQLDIFNKKMQGTELKGDYFPVMRFGKYAVEYTDGDINEDTGELISKFSKFESDDAAREFIASNPSIKSKGVTKDFVNDNKSALTGNRSLDALWKSVDAKFEKVETGGNIKEIADDVKDYLFQMHLMGRPEQSIAKRFLHRKGTAGYDNDIFRSFDTYGLSMSKQLPRIKLSGVIMGKLENLKSELPENETLGTDYYNAFKKQISDVVYPKQINSFVNTMTGAAFHYYLSAPASAALQLASIPLQGAPSIAKVHGVNAARRALNSAVGLYTGSMSRATPFGDIARGAKGRKDIGNLVKGAKHANEFDIPKAMEMMKAEGLLLPSIHAQAFSGQDKPTSKSDSAFAKAKRVMEITSRPFAEAESAARQVSAVAAYIANMRSGMTHEKAVRAAIDSTYLDLGDFGATGQSSLVKTGLGGMVKIASQFQQYGAKLLFAFAKAGHDALKGESPEVKKQGRKFIGGLLAMHYIFAGSLGLPLAGLAMTITDFIRDVAGDHDERHDLEDDMRKAMHDMNINDTVIKMILDGPVGTITGMNLTPRIGAGDIIPMIQESDLNETLKGDIVGNAGKALLGAAGSTVANIGKATEAWTEGNYGQAIERLMPAAIRNVMTAARYATEGKLTPKGLPIMTKEEITTLDIVARALGMETSHMAEKSKAARSAYMLNEFIKDRKQELYSKYAKATPKEQDRVMDTIVKFAERHPGAGVSANSIISSLRGKEEAPYKATRGQMLGKNAPEIEDYIQELEQD